MENFKKTKNGARGFLALLHYYNSDGKPQELALTASPQLTIVSDIDTAEAADCSDRLLLDAWTRHRDADALAHLVQRYSALVMSVCRRQCRTHEDAEDAFQATFLTLSRDANRLRRQECLAGWLHQVAYRTACRARKRSQMMETLVQEPPDPRDSLAAIAHRHRLRALDEELDQLPKAYRTAIVLHYFEGCTYEQTAEMLQSTEPAVRGRLQRARARLQRRLTRRGFSLSAVIGSVAVLSKQQATAGQSLPSGLLEQTVARCAGPSVGNPVSSNLESLLTKETPMLLSTTSLGTLGAAAIAVAGWMMVQTGSDPAGTAGPQTVEMKADASSAPQARVEVDPFGGAASIDPFSGQGAGSDPFGAPSVPKSVKPAAEVKPAEVDPFGDNGGEPFGSAPTQEPQQEPRTATWATGNAAFHQRIEQALSQSVQFDFFDMPLKEAVMKISQDHAIPMLVDDRALEEIGLSVDTPIDLSISHVSLASALNLMLNSNDLTYTVDNEVVTITTKEADESQHPLLRIYWTGELGLQASSGSAQLIQTLIEPDSWEVMGGTGTISLLNAEDLKNSGFGIRTTYQTHRKIEQFLQSVQSGAKEPLTGMPAEDPNSGGMGGMGGGMM
ncbi:sigma-70 family RNA polymerase sigma factor [Novipirellula artificiosorum]|uniref:ECF RNA polymerase sigma factor SigE n=1 Tax=Novipirellula artificiosorum TaxID=2528016 RepID=A0A5C6D7S1_9BACT|nr:sigma-70 family RNA polymerase sigma factor [Novipirellula artificiosorum]TWU31751.1 ECF RNA polymerase sigma factor SigE [Novipirellula artificiosorum]